MVREKIKLELCFVDVLCWLDQEIKRGQKTAIDSRFRPDSCKERLVLLFAFTLQVDLKAEIRRVFRLHLRQMNHHLRPKTVCGQHLRTHLKLRKLSQLQKVCGRLMKLRMWSWLPRVFWQRWSSLMRLRKRNLRRDFQRGPSMTCTGSCPGRVDQAQGSVHQSSQVARDFG